MQVIFLAKDKHTENPTFLRFLEVGALRGHLVETRNKKAFLASDLLGVDIVCLKSYLDDKRIWEMITAHTVRAVNNFTSSECCSERSQLDALLGAGGIRTPRCAITADDLASLNYPIIRKPNVMSAPRDMHIFHQPPTEIDCERYFYQEMIPSGVTYKGYCIGAETFLVTELDVANGETARTQVPISGHLMQATREVGSLTRLEVYGVDFVGSPEEPFLIDINPFPSFRALPQAAEVLWAYLEKLG
jgi:hypothetical protein